MAAITTAVVGVVGAGVSMGMSIDQANKSASARREAQKQAEKAMEEAKRETEIMPLQELSLDLAAYDQAREAQNVAAATAIDAAQQGEGRGLAAAVGRVQAQNIAGQQNIRAQQGREQMQLDKIKAQERARASDQRRQLELGEAQGAQAAAADAAARQRMATQQAVQSGADMVVGAANLYDAVQGPFDPQSLDYMSASGVTGSEMSGFTSGGYTFGMSDPLPQQSIQPSNLSGPMQFTDPNTGQVTLLDPRTGRPIR
jgi:hypothetical protein